MFKRDLTPSAATGLAAWWPADGDTNDLVNGQTAFLLNGATFTTGKFGQAFSFDGVNDAIHIPASIPLDVGAEGTGITLEAWIKPDDTRNCPLFEWETTVGSGGLGSMFWMGGPNGGSAGSLYADVIDSVRNDHVFNTAGSLITAGVWQHVALTYDKQSGRGRIYINGLVVADQSLGIFTPLTAHHLSLGYRYNKTPYKGAMDEPAIYSRALGADEIFALATADSPNKCSSPAGPARVDAASAFTSASNPNGVWRYGSTASLGAAFVPFASPSSDANTDGWQPTGGFGSSKPFVGHNKTDGLLSLFGAAIVIMPEEILMFPGSGGQYSVVRWTAPASGTYHFDGFFEPLDNTSTDVHIRQNSSGAVYDNVLNFDRMAIDKFGVTRQVGMGDTIDFAVGFGSSGNSSDSTGLRLLVSALSALAADQSPTVSAGPDLAIILPSSATLRADVGDDGLPAGSVVSYAWAKVSGPGTVTASPGLGTGASPITTTANFTVPGTYVLRLTATDGQLSSSDDVTVRVYASGTANTAPVVNAGPDQLAALSGAAALSGTVADDGLPVSSALSATWTKVSGPGTVTFGDSANPSTTANFSVTGTYTLRLTASDGTLSTSDDIVITVNNNQAPQVTAGSNFATTQNVTTTLAGYVTDDGLPSGALSIQWTQISGPGTATFTNAGKTNTTVQFGAPGTYVLRLTANDGQAVGTATATVVVDHGPNQPPVVSAGPDQILTLPGVITLHGTASDDGYPSGVLEASWSKVSGPGTVTFENMDGVYQASFSQEGSYVLRYTASDGSLSSSADMMVTALSFIPPPVVQILSPLDAAALTSPTVVTGTVSSIILSSYQLQYRLRGAEDEDPEWITLSTNNVNVTSGPVGILDPTMLLNGIYEIRLSATDQLNRTEMSDIVTVVVDRNMKVGHFSVSFSDLTVPVAGVPIEIVRTYDSRDKRQGDFGVGWNLGLRNIRLQKNRNLGVNWDQSSSGGFFPTYSLDPRNPRVVTITFPDGKAYKFTMKVTPDSQFGVPFASVHISYAASSDMPGTLVSVDGDDADVVGSVPGLVDYVDFNTGNIYNPSLFKLTTQEGDIYIIDEKVGLKSMTDRNGNTLTITPEGIIHSSGKSVTFVRDTDGRINQITDPAGNSIRYLYTTNGDLAQFIDRVSNTNSYSYDATHRLLTIVDPRGIQPLRNEFDDSGRLVRQIDSNNHTNNFLHDLSVHREFITDRLGFTTVHEYDDDGNVIRTTDPLGNVTAYTFDANDNQLSKTDALTNTTHFAYDLNNNKVQEVDPLGFTNRWTYDNFRNVLTITDGRGFTRTNVYDPDGNLVNLIDNLGNVTQFTYDIAGNVLTKTDPLGNITEYAYENFNRQTNVLVRDARFGVLNSTSYRYDANGNQTNRTTTRTTPSGTEALITSYIYDLESRLIATVNPDGSSTQTTFNGIGKAVQEIDQLGRQTAHEFDGQGNLVRTMYPDSTFEVFAYDPENHKISAQDRGGRNMIYTNDALGRLTTAVFPDGATTVAVYDAISRLMKTIDERGNATQFEYDPHCGCSGRRTKLLDALNHETHFTYDGNANEESMTDPLGQVTQYSYDADNRRTQILFVDGTYATTVYDSAGRKTAEIDQSGRATISDYDALGRLIAVTDALGHVTRYQYDEAGNLVAQTDANYHTTTFAYDSMGRRISRSLPGGQTENFSYDLAGNVTNRIDFNGRSTRFSYDASDRLLQKIPDAYFGQPPITFTYTATGKRASMSDSSGISGYEYNERDWLTNKITPQGTLSYTRDSHGNLLSIHSSNMNGASVAYRWDPLNRLSAAVDSILGQTTYGYDAAGNLAAYAYPNGLQTANSYDRLNRLTNVITLTSANSPVSGYAYQLAPTGHRSAVIEVSGRTVAYQYDPTYRLTRESISGLPSHPSGTIDYTYDAVGNRLSRFSSVPGVISTSDTFDPDDRLGSDTYDSNGNTIVGRVVAGGPVFSDQFDFEDRLLARPSAQAQTVYDGDGNRVRETVTGITTLYLVDDANPTGYAQVVEELMVAGANSSVTRTYMYGSGIIAQDQLINNTWMGSFYGLDGHGSTRYLTDSVGALLNTEDFDAFGVSVDAMGAVPNNYRYCGEQFDSALGIYYLRSRYLNTQSGRFWTMINLSRVFSGGKTI